MHVVLVHGTWARRGIWLRPHSTLRKELDRILPEPVQFHVFRWSGWNSHKARYRAAIQLNNFIYDQLADADPLKIFIIAHSHGGNVVTYASGMSNLCGVVAGTIFLGTPFFNFRYRNNTKFLLNIVVNTVRAFTYFTLGILFLYLWYSIDWSFVDSPSSIVIQLLMLFITEFFANVLPSFFREIVKDRSGRLGERSKKICDLFRQPPLPAGKVLLCRRRLDELGIFLKSFSALLSTFKWIYAFTSFAVEFPFRALVLFFFVSAIVNYVLVAGRFAEDAISPSIISLILLLAVFLIFFASILAIRYISSIVASNPLVFGPDKFVDHAFIEVSVSGYPNLNGESCDLVNVGRFSLFSLSHSSYYRDIITIQAIRTWMSAKIVK